MSSWAAVREADESGALLSFALASEGEAADVLAPLVQKLGADDAGLLLRRIGMSKALAASLSTRVTPQLTKPLTWARVVAADKCGALQRLGLGDGRRAVPRLNSLVGEQDAADAYDQLTRLGLRPPVALRVLALLASRALAAAVPYVNVRDAASAKTRVVEAAVANQTGVVRLDLGGRLESREVVYRAIFQELGDKLADEFSDFGVSVVTRLFQRVKAQHRRLHPAAIDWVPTVIAEVRTGGDQHDVIYDIATAFKALNTDRRSCRVILVLSDADAAFGLPVDEDRQALIWIDDFTIDEAMRFLDNVGCLPLHRRIDSNGTDLNEQLRRSILSPQCLPMCRRRRSMSASTSLLLQNWHKQTTCCVACLRRARHRAAPSFGAWSRRCFSRPSSLCRPSSSVAIWRCQTLRPRC